MRASIHGQCKRGRCAKVRYQEIKRPRDQDHETKRQTTRPRRRDQDHEIKRQTKRPRDQRHTEIPRDHETKRPRGQETKRPKTGHEERKTAEV